MFDTLTFSSQNKSKYFLNPDDISVGKANKIFSFCSNTLSDPEHLINFELQSLNRWLIANKSSLNIAKTEFMVIGSRQRLATFDDPELCVTVNNASVKRVKPAKTL